MNSVEQDIRAANESFYRAFESLDIEKMDAVWSGEEDVACGHPGWQLLRGRKVVMESWRRIFENTPSIRFMLTDVTIHLGGDFAWVTLYENLNSAVGDQKVSATVLTTNIFKKGPEGWRMIHHHGSSVAAPTETDETPTVH